ncbi:ABC-2 type transporter-domain-containing protein [Aspergillus pseudoustus]|uniref:ABC-2 type transporter-domain-containing protein n=1 Tax=Aspergillus pseudoustus TaxID=1810923 RepID=A0ABR4JEU2_9EURO
MQRLVGKESTPDVAASKNDIDSGAEAVTGIASGQLGRRLSTISTLSTNDPRLNPNSPDFDYQLWSHSALRAMVRSGFTPPSLGLVFESVCVSGAGSALQYQETITSLFAIPFRKGSDLLSHSKSHSRRRRILNDFDGLIKSGELLLVLGRPGSGCTTFLKTICGHLGGLTLEPGSHIWYDGIRLDEITKHFRGEVVYNQEIDTHFAHLTVGETLSFAAHARAPHQRVEGMTRSEYATLIVDVVMAVFGLSHTKHTKVGDNFVRGVSGGERKRVSIAEMFLSRCRFGAWDNSTRGLDAATALQFVKALRLSSDINESCHAVAAYQASQSMYDLFDKVVVLYEGHEIYFGSSKDACTYFETMGWERPQRQVAPDFLTSITNPAERKARPGMETQVPRTAREFAQYWKQSAESKALKQDMSAYRNAHPADGSDLEGFHAEHRRQQAQHTRRSSPYLLSVPMQVRLCMRRSFQLLRNDLPTTMSTVVVQVVLSIILGSVFYNSPSDSSAFFQKGAILFFAVLMNALITMNEIMTLYTQRPIVEKQTSYAFVHPFTEALASIIVDLPAKLSRCSAFSIVLYFMTNLRREPSQFFIFFLFLITAIMTMSGIFRTMAAMTKSIGQAMALAGILILCIVVYTGFSLPVPYMHPWLSWIRWINPIFYAFESLVSNEFHGRDFECASPIPSYGTGSSFICSALGSIAGEMSVSGDDFIDANYNYHYSHVWRNYGILLAFMVFFTSLYLIATELRTGTISKAEALVFRPGHAPSHLRDDVESLARTTVASIDDAEKQTSEIPHFPRQSDILSWKGLNYDIPVHEGIRRLLDDVNGWVKPGTLTALMGVSGAGKTTLLDVLAQRVSIGVVNGEIRINAGAPRASFARRTGYVQQQDLHLETTTVREALQFSAMLRQSKTVSKSDKYAYAEEVIKLLGMEDFAEAVVGTLGEGLNVEQRKLLSIGVELAAKPTLLVFLDEPTSGLDSQSSWTICSLLRKLADNGQAVLATIHQPSALLFQMFDRLLFLAKGGRTVYFGEIGDQSSTLLEYFERHGARKCQPSENPAEYMIETVSNNEASIDWPDVWKKTPEYEAVVAELHRIQSASPDLQLGLDTDNDDSEFAMPFSSQLYYVLRRVFSQYFRQPEYIASKYILGIISGLFIGFSFWRADSTQQGFQNALFSIFLLCTIFGTMVNQIIPKFVMQRSLYEVRERPSRVYSWKVFIISQMLVEVPWQLFLGVCVWACFYFSVFGTSTDAEARGLVLLFIVQFYIYAASMAQFTVAALDQPAVAAMLATLMFGLSFLFNGVMQPPSQLPRFWIFMYRVSPFTYYVGGISSTALHGRAIQCNDVELKVFDSPAGETCQDYLADYLDVAGGSLYNPNATSGCEYCSMSSSADYLAQREIFHGDRWRNYGIFCCYFVFNIFGAITLYYIFRVRRWNLKSLIPSRKPRQ